MRSTVILSLTAFASSAFSQRLLREQTLPTDAPAFSKTAWVTRVLNVNEGFNHTMRDEGYVGTCSIVFSETQPDTAPRPCVPPTFQWQYTTWTNESSFNYTVDHALKDQSGTVWIKTVGDSVTKAKTDLLPNARGFELFFNGVKKADDQNWNGDAYPKPASN